MCEDNHNQKIAATDIDGKNKSPIDKSTELPLASIRNDLEYTYSQER
jgi:hypothetical protein